MRWATCKTWESCRNLRGRQLELAMLLDINLIGPVNQNIGNLRIGEQRLDGAEPNHLIDDFGRQAILLRLIEQELFLIGDLAHQSVHKTGKLLLRHAHRSGGLDLQHDLIAN